MYHHPIKSASTRKLHQASRAHQTPGGEKGEKKENDHMLHHWKQRIQTQEDEQLLLHQTVVASKKQQIETQQERLAQQRAFIRHEKRKLLLQNALLESERERFEASLTSDWFCTSAFPSSQDRRVVMDVGGQIFELSARLASNDPMSLLAALIEDDSPLSRTDCGCFHIDRDWWLFRNVLRFLRDGFLPSKPKLLRALYLESEFWKLESLRKAIEMKNMASLQIKLDLDPTEHLSGRQSNGTKARMKATGSAASDLSSKQAKSKDPDTWWLDPPLWWDGSDAKVDKKEKKKKQPSKLAVAAAAVKKTKAEATEIDTWWKATTYKGTDFTEILSSEQKKKIEHDGNASTTPRKPVLIHSTWSPSEQS